MSFNKQQFIEEKKKEFMSRFDDLTGGDNLRYYLVDEVWNYVEQSLNEAITRFTEQAVLDYILSLGWQDTENEYVKEVLKDAERIANKLYRDKLLK